MPSRVSALLGILSYENDIGLDKRLVVRLQGQHTGRRGERITVLIEARRPKAKTQC